MSNDTPASNKHLWVELRYVPLIVTEQADDSLVVEVSDQALAVADEEAMQGCWYCNTPLTHEAFQTECDPLE